MFPPEGRHRGDALRMAVFARSLYDVQQEIDGYLRQGAVLVFWQHEAERFDYLLERDQTAFKTELKSLRRQLRGGETINEAIAGEPIVIKGTTLYPMLLRIVNQPCIAYALLTERGMLVDDSEYTPYFFKSKNTRNGAVRYMNIRPS